MSHTRTVQNIRLRTFLYDVFFKVESHFHIHNQSLFWGCIWLLTKKNKRRVVSTCFLTRFISGSFGFHFIKWMEMFSELLYGDDGRKIPEKNKQFIFFQIMLFWLKDISLLNSCWKMLNAQINAHNWLKYAPLLKHFFLFWNLILIDR